MIKPTINNLDQLSVDRIKLLHPKVRIEAMQILNDIHAKVNTPTSFCRFTFTLRTMSEQQAIYNQGRTKPGEIVTRAKPGQSIHNYGLAIDVSFILNNKEASWDTNKDWDKDGKSDWMEVVAIFKSYGWTWGGDWETFVDKPHFEKPFGHTWRTLLKLRNEGKIDKEGYVII